MVSEETARRIADALERLAAVVEKLAHPPMASTPDNSGNRGVPWLGSITMEKTQGPNEVVYRTFWEPRGMVCYRCIPPHVLDWANPCRSHRGNAE